MISLSRKNERGATLLEFVLVGPIFLLFLIVSCDLLRLTYQILTIEYVAARVVRQVVVGPGQRPAAYGNQGAWLKNGIVDRAKSMFVPVALENIQICSARRVATGQCFAANGPDYPGDADVSDQIIAVRIEVPNDHGFLWGAKNRLIRFPFKINPVLVVTRNERW